MLDFDVVTGPTPKPIDRAPQPPAVPSARPERPAPPPPAATEGHAH